MDRQEIIMFSVMAMIIIGLIVCIAILSEQRQSWLDEHCEVIGNVSGSSAPTIGFITSGNMTFGSTYIPGKTGYQCDDGLEYWK